MGQRRERQESSNTVAWGSYAIGFEMAQGIVSRSLSTPELDSVFMTHQVVCLVPREKADEFEEYADHLLGDLSKKRSWHSDVQLDRVKKTKNKENNDSIIHMFYSGTIFRYDSAPPPERVESTLFAALKRLSKKARALGGEGQEIELLAAEVPLSGRCGPSEWETVLCTLTSLMEKKYLANEILDPIQRKGLPRL